MFHTQSGAFELSKISPARMGLTGDDDDGDDMPQLSGDAMAALKEFYADRDNQEKKFEDLKAAAEDQHQKLSMDMFAEDWNASQFWYKDSTAVALATELLRGATCDTSIAVVSAPSVFVQLRNLVSELEPSDRPQLKLLEFDDRFEVLKEFVRYDFKSPLSLPPELKGKFDCLICDPPFLSEECQTKAALTVRWLSKPASTENSPVKIIVCTGERMETLIHKVYPSCRTTTFRPEHTKGLSNEFRCYANFESSTWTWES